MKYILISLIFLSLTIQAFSDECSTYLFDGQIQLQTASNKFMAATMDYQAAGAEMAKTYPDTELVCSKLITAMNLFDESSPYFNKCGLTFKLAMGVCKEESLNLAIKLSDYCYATKSQSEAGSDIISESIPDYCQ